MRGKCAPDGDNGDYVPFSELDVPGNGVEKRERENRKKTESGRCEGGEREREKERETGNIRLRIWRKKIRSLSAFQSVTLFAGALQRQNIVSDKSLCRNIGGVPRL